MTVLQARVAVAEPEPCATVDEARPPRGPRLTSLDGLRGLAALVVLAHHTAYLSATFSNAYTSPDTRPDVGSLLWWLTSTPLRLLTAGPEAVLLFFVLSGFVLSLPVLRRGSKQGPFDWLSFFPQRIVRLMLPVAAAVVFAAAIVAAHPQVGRSGSNAWLDRMATADVSFPFFLQNLDLLAGSTQLDNPLWSLRWELLFSVLLPAFIGLAVVARRRPLAAGGLALVLLFLGSSTFVPSLTYLPVFFLGVLLALHRDAVGSLATRLSRTRFSNALWAACLLLSVGLFILNRIVGPLIDRTAWSDGLLGTAATALGAVGLMVVAMHWRPLDSFCSTRIVQWTGRVSFSLYLVHVPILIGLSYWTGSWRTGAMLGVPLSLGVAELFHRFVERPSHRLARRVGATVAARLEVSV